MVFSVIVPTYNRCSLLPRSLETLQNLDFPVSEYEVIVIDNGSRDGTANYLAGWSARNFLVLRQETNSGPASARNWGARHSSSLYLAFTDDDCLVPSDWLLSLRQGLEKWPGAGAVGGFLEAPPSILDSNLLAQLESYETREVYKAGDQEYLGGFESPAGGTNNIAYRREIFENLGGFDETFPVPAGEDADLKLRTVAAGYQIGYRPIKVTHLDPYSFKTFVRRSLAAGVGSAYFERKHQQKIDTGFGLAVKVLWSSVRTFWLLIFGGWRAEKKLRLLLSLREVLMNFGRLKAFFTLPPKDF